MSSDSLHRVYLSLGSNIAPYENLPRAVQLLREHGTVEALSTAWETLPVGAPGPNFLNAAALFHTHLAVEELKNQVLRPIERRLGRVRTADKNAPRTIDLDVILYDEQLLDGSLWTRPHLAVPLAQLYPEYRHPETGESLARLARRLARAAWLEPHPEVFGR